MKHVEFWINTDLIQITWKYIELSSDLLCLIFGSILIFHGLKQYRESKIGMLLYAGAGLGFIAAANI